MIYLYWFVVIVGVTLTPIITGFLYEKKRRATIGKSYSSRPDSFEYAMTGIGVGVAFFFWPLVVPVATLAAIVYGMFKLPKWILDKAEKRSEKSNS